MTSNDTSTAKLVAEMESYIRSEAKRAAHKSGGRVDAEDLAQVGRIAALQQASRFDLTKGVKFVTYALPLIQREIRRAAVRGGSVVSTSTVIRTRTRDVSLSVEVRVGGEETGTTGEELLPCARPTPEAATEAAQFEAKVRTIVNRVKWERFAEKAKLFDAVVERLMAGEMVAERFCSDIGFADIAAQHGITRQNVQQWDTKIRAVLTEALQEAR